MGRIKKLLGRRILGRKCWTDHWRKDDGSVLLYKTEEQLDTTNWVRVIMASDDCRIFDPSLLERHKVYMKFPEYESQWFRKVGDDLWLADEEQMDFSEPTLAPFVALEPKE